MSIPTTRSYSTHVASAPWCKCQVCGIQAVIGIELNVRGRFGRKGSRSLGYYCQPHGDEKLKALRAKVAP